MESKGEQLELIFKSNLLKCPKEQLTNKMVLKRCMNTDSNEMFNLMTSLIGDDELDDLARIMNMPANEDRVPHQNYWKNVALHPNEYNIGTIAEIVIAQGCSSTISDLFPTRQWIQQNLI